MACAICSGVTSRSPWPMDILAMSPLSNLSAVRRLHVLVVRHTAFYFAAQRNAALGAETEPLRPVDDRLRARLDSDLIKPGVARFG